MQSETRWYHFIAYFFGGAFLANTIPHLVNGISGSPFQSPFASPPGQGLSSSMVNVLWGMFNLAVAYVLVARVGRFDLRQTRHVVVLGLGILVMALMLAQHFGSFMGATSDADSRRRQKPQALLLICIALARLSLGLRTCEGICERTPPRPPLRKGGENRVARHPLSPLAKGGAGGVVGCTQCM